MPTYDYECTKCGAVVELFQPITEAPRRKLRKDDPKPCDCNAPVQRQIGTGGGVIFKGSGFYQTDYRSEGYKKAAKADKEATSGTADKGTGKDSKGNTNKTTESKPVKKDSSTKTTGTSD